MTYECISTASRRRSETRFMNVHYYICWSENSPIRVTQNWSHYLFNSFYAIHVDTGNAHPTIRAQLSKRKFAHKDKAAYV